jgi:hypothetical protein
VNLGDLLKSPNHQVVRALSLNATRRSFVPIVDIMVKLCGGAEIYTDARAASRRRTHRLWRSKHMSPKRIPPDVDRRAKAVQHSELQAAKVHVVAAFSSL